jgi:hypothetical protein
MPARPPRTRQSQAAKPEAAGAGSEGLRLRLQLLAAFVVPLLAVGLWLQSRGFFAQG